MWTFCILHGYQKGVKGVFIHEMLQLQNHAESRVVAQNAGSIRAEWFCRCRVLCYHNSIFLMLIKYELSNAKQLDQLSMKITKTMLNHLQPTDKSFIEQKAYQQALSDFGIEELLEKLSNYYDADFDAAKMHLKFPELELLAAIVVQQLTNNLNGKLISGYLNAIRNSNSELLPTSINEEIQIPNSALPNNFPNVETPLYSEGKSVRWKSPLEKTDWGIVIGRFYAYASHLCCWTWKYIILLDSDSPSTAWCLADTAWEEDLQEVDCEK